MPFTARDAAAPTQSGHGEKALTRAGTPDNSARRERAWRQAARRTCPGRRLPPARMRAPSLYSGFVLPNGLVVQRRSAQRTVRCKRLLGGCYSIFAPLDRLCRAQSSLMFSETIDDPPLEKGRS